MAQLTTAPEPSGAGPSATLVRVVGVLVRAVLIAGILVAAFIAYGLLDNRWYKVVAVVGGSMSPTIEPGDLIVLTRPPETIRTGMILTLEVGGKVVTHRVVGFRTDGSFVTKGDANDVRDDFRGHEVRVVGEYRFGIPWLGNLLRVGRTSGPASGAFFIDRVSVGGQAETAERFAPEEPLLMEPPAPQPEAASPPIEFGQPGDEELPSGPADAGSPTLVPPPEPAPTSEPEVPVAEQPATAAPEPSAPASEPASPPSDPTAPPSMTVTPGPTPSPVPSPIPDPPPDETASPDP